MSDKLYVIDHGLPKEVMDLLLMIDSDIPLPVVKELWENYHRDIENLEEALTEHYEGCWNSEREYVENFIKETQDLDKLGFLAGYIDYESLRRDMFEFSGDNFSIEYDGKKYIFSMF